MKSTLLHLRSLFTIPRGDGEWRGWLRDVHSLCTSLIAPVTPFWTDLEIFANALSNMVGDQEMVRPGLGVPRYDRTVSATQSSLPPSDIDY
jgi:hypothetical protein